jgi:hypothetical protein
MIAVTDQAAPRRRLVHVVNHAYDAGILPQASVAVTITSDAAPASAMVISPDATPDSAMVPFTYANGQVRVVLPSLIAYDVVVLAY